LKQKEQNIKECRRHGRCYFGLPSQRVADGVKESAKAQVRRDSAVRSLQWADLPRICRFDGAPQLLKGKSSEDAKEEFFIGRFTTQPIRWHALSRLLEFLFLNSIDRSCCIYFSFELVVHVDEMNIRQLFFEAKQNSGEVKSPGDTAGHFCAFSFPLSVLSCLKN
jgi:hypothetical protein